MAETEIKTLDEIIADALAVATEMKTLDEMIINAVAVAAEKTSNDLRASFDGLFNLAKDLYKYSPNSILSEKEVSKYTGVALPTLRAWRKDRINLPFSKIGNSVKYEFKDVLDYISKNKVHVTQNGRII